jgi:hypothetical protein
MYRLLPLSDYRCYRIEFLCEQGACRYWIRDFEIGNCVLRCKREYNCSEIARRIGISRQAIQGVEKQAMAKLRGRGNVEMILEVDEYVQGL